MQQTPLQLDLAVDKLLQTGSHRFHLQMQIQSPSRRMVLLGGSGSGKTLTIRSIAGLLRPDRGHVRVAGNTLFDSAVGIDLPPQQRNMGYLFQDYALFPHLNVRQNVAFGLRHGWRNPSPRRAPQVVEDWLDTLGLQPMARLMPHALSGGQRQRVALARALVTHPHALLLDEPFSALDPALRQALRLELDELQRRLQVPMVLITHDLEDARVLGEHVIHLQQGRVVREEWRSDTLPAGWEAPTRHHQEAAHATTTGIAAAAGA